MLLLMYCLTTTRQSVIFSRQRRSPTIDIWELSGAGLITPNAFDSEKTTNYKMSINITYYYNVTLLFISVIYREDFKANHNNKPRWPTLVLCWNFLIQPGRPVVDEVAVSVEEGEALTSRACWSSSSSGPASVNILLLLFFDAKH
jgi:hypothetical protein